MSEQELKFLVEAKSHTVLQLMQERRDLADQLQVLMQEMETLSYANEGKELSNTLKRWANTIAVAAPFVLTAVVSTPTVAGPAVALGCAATAINEATKQK